MSDTFGLKIGIEGEKAFKQSLRDINNDFKVLGSEMKLATSAFDKNERSVESLTATNKALENQITSQRSKIDTLKSALDNASQSFGENDRRTKAWQIQLNNATADLNKMEREVSANEKAISELSDEMNDGARSANNLGDEIRRSGNEADRSKGKLDGLGKGIKGMGSAIGGAVVGLGAGIAAIGASFFGLAESTRETRENMGKLETGFTTAGHSADAAKNTYTELYGVLGDSGQATEAASHLAKLTNNEKELARWTDIATGVYATFGDSLPIENLAEAANETAKTGKITGGLADALNWAGVAEDEFQASLDRCTTEQERQALITETMNGLYSEASDKYKEVNGDIIDAQKATAALNSAMAELGAVAEPVLTTLKELVTGLLNELLPFVEQIGEGFTGLIEGTEGAAESFSEGLLGMVTLLIEKAVEMLPLLLDIALQLITTLAVGIAEALPTLIPTIISVIMQIITTLIENLPLILDAALQLIIGLAQGLLNAIPVLISYLPAIINAIVEFIIQGIPMIIEAGIQLLTSLVTALPIIIESIVAALPLIIESIVVGILEGLPLIIQAGIDLLIALVQALPQIITTIVQAIPEIISSIVNALLGNIDKIIIAGVELLVALIANLPTIIVEIVKAVPQIIAGIVSAFGNLMWKIVEIGGNIVKGLWDGITGLAGWLWDKVSGWISGIWDGIMDFFGIASPSKEMAWIGEMLVEGLAGAIDKDGKYAIDAATSMSKGIMDTMNGLGADMQNALSSDFSANVKGTVNGNLNDVHQNAMGTIGSMITIHQMIVRSEDDIRKISQELYNLMQTGSRARGRVLAT